MIKKYEDEIQALLEQMTLSEKTGQLRQCGPSIAGAFAMDFEELVNMVFDGRISKEKFQEMTGSANIDFHEEDLRAGKIGSYNGINDAKTANYLQKIAVEETRLGIPLLFGYDVVHGYRTIFPIPLAESCAWEPALWEKTARAAAKEATAGGNHITFAPVVDVAKDARWGRISEGAGEDAYLTSAFGQAKVKGFQGESLSDEDSMAACIKHFAAYGAAEAGRDYNRVDMSTQRLFEEYLPPFRACIEAGARVVMPAFNDINGVPCTASQWLMKELLRKQWGFDGMTISDANAIAECVEHGIASDRMDAAWQAICAGVDMDMASDCYSQCLEDLIESGKLDSAILDEAVANILRIKFELGLFEQPCQTTDEREAQEMLNPQSRALARECAAKSMVLLKNDGILPLKPDVKLGIVGALADNRSEMMGAWAIRGDGNDCISIVDACRAQNKTFIYSTGIKKDPPDWKESGTAEVFCDCVDETEVLRIADECDVILAVVGEYKNQSGEAASRADISLSDTHMKLLHVLKGTGKPVVAVLFNGRPLAIPWLKENLSGILEAWHPGVEAGNAVLDILYGCVNPSGKLTTTFPYTSGQCPVYYSHINTGRPGGKAKFTSKYLDTPVEPVYPFGYGLSYTSYTYTKLMVEQKPQGICAAVMVKNNGSRDGDEIVQCYFRDLTAKRVRPVKQLAAFKKVSIKAGGEKNVVFEIPYQSMGYYDWRMKFVIESGKYEIFIGGNSEECLTKEVELKDDFTAFL